MTAGPIAVQAGIRIHTYPCVRSYCSGNLAHESPATKRPSPNSKMTVSAVHAPPISSAVRRVGIGQYLASSDM